MAFTPKSGRGKSDGLYDEGFEKDRSRYSMDPSLSLPDLERALIDMAAAASYLAARPDVDSKRMQIGGQSRGGIAACLQACTWPKQFVEFFNFVGDWVGDRSSNAEAINRVSFKRAVAFAAPMLWLYGKNDPYYQISHSQKNFDAFIKAGGKGVFKIYTPTEGQSGHGIISMPELWRDPLNDYLTQLGMQ